MENKDTLFIAEDFSIFSLRYVLCLLTWTNSIRAGALAGEVSAYQVKMCNVVTKKHLNLGTCIGRTLYTLRIGFITHEACVSFKNLFFFGIH